MVLRDTYGTATLTPFLPKATFTSVKTPGNLSESTEDKNPSLTATLEPTLLEETSPATITGQVSSTPSSSPTSNGTQMLVSATSTLLCLLPLQIQPMLLTHLNLLLQ